MKLLDKVLDIRPLRSSPAFRRLWIGNSLSGLGGQLTGVAVLYQVWQLTHSSLLVGAVALAKAVPMVVLGLVGGALADAVDRRRLVLLTTVTQIVCASLLAAQSLAGVRSVWIVLGLVALQAAGAALGAPARRTFAVRLLPVEQVGAGLALTHLSFQTAMLVGPAVAGLLIAQWDVSGCYLVDTLSFVAALYGVARLPSMRPTGERVSLGIGAVWQGWRFIGRKPVLGGAFLTDVLATVLAMPISLFPMINAERFGGRPETLGLFFSAIAVGGIAASLASGAVTRSARPGAVMLTAATMWGLGLVGFGVALHPWLALGCLAVAGAADTVSVVSRGLIVQLATDDSYRGRVSAVEHIIGVSGPDLGSFRGGVVASATSAPFAVVSGGLLCVLGVVALASLNASLRRFTPADATPRAVEPGPQQPTETAAEDPTPAPSGAAVDG